MGRVTISRSARADIKNTWGKFKIKETEDFVDIWNVEKDGKWYIVGVRFKDGNTLNPALSNLETINPLDYLEFLDKKVAE